MASMFVQGSIKNLSLYDPCAICAEYIQLILLYQVVYCPYDHLEAFWLKRTLNFTNSEHCHVTPQGPGIPRSRHAHDHFPLHY